MSVRVLELLLSPAPTYIVVAIAVTITGVFVSNSSGDRTVDYVRVRMLTAITLVAVIAIVAFEVIGVFRLQHSAGPSVLRQMGNPTDNDVELALWRLLAHHLILMWAAVALVLWTRHRRRIAPPALPRTGRSSPQGLEDI